MSTAASLTAAQRRAAARHAQEYQENVDDKMKIHLGKFLLMKDGKIVAGFESREDAHKAARLIWEKGSYSIEERKGPRPRIVVTGPSWKELAAELSVEVTE